MQQTEINPERYSEVNSGINSWLTPDWPVPAHVRAVCTTRAGGVSAEPFDALNLGDHVGDEPDSVAQNRHLLREKLDLPAEPLWLEQVHGIEVYCPDDTSSDSNNSVTNMPKADATAVFDKQQVAIVMTADCLPVLFCDQDGTRVAAAHAGWRGLCNGVLERTVQRLGRKSEQLMAWLGPAIGPEMFEVGAEVRDAFISHDARAIVAFKSRVQEGKYLADIYQLARQRLTAVGVDQVYGGGLCTFTDNERFFSYRRAARTGRMASLIWRV